MIPWGSQFLILEDQELDNTYFLGSNFLCFLPDNTAQRLAGMSLRFFECFSRRGDEQRLSSLSIDRRCPRHVCVPSGTFASLTNPGERESSYSAISSVFGIPSFTSVPRICMNGWKRGERKPTQHCKHFCYHFMRWVVSCAKTNFSEVAHPLYFRKTIFLC